MNAGMHRSSAAADEMLTVTCEAAVRRRANTGVKRQDAAFASDVVERRLAVAQLPLLRRTALMASLDVGVPMFFSATV